MYLEHFGLQQQPFQLTPDANFLYLSKGHKRAKAYMDYTVWNRDGFVVITGEIGSGKTTLTLALQNQFDIPFLRFSFDLFLDFNALPMEQIKHGTFSWSSMRPSVFNGLHQCIPALATAGNNLIVDHIIETQAWMIDLVKLLSEYDVYFVGLHCSLPELERREIERGNRRTGEARADFEIVHTFGSYDLELSSEDPLEDNIAALITAWKNRSRPSAFDQMAKDTGVRH